MPSVWAGGAAGGGPAIETAVTASAGMSAPLFFCLLCVCFVNACLFVRQVGRAILFSIGMGMSAAEADLCLKTLDLILNKT